MAMKPTSASTRNKGRAAVSRATSSGLGVDAEGGPVIDPTANVIALTEAGTLRQDDLREAHSELMDVHIQHLKEISTLRAAHEAEIRKLEADRLDKIRAVDVQNAGSTAAQLLAAVQTLASTTQLTAETLRNQVTTTAQSVAAQTERIVNPIIERIALLEKTSYVGAGRQAVVDPQLTELLAEMKTQRGMVARGEGKGEGFSASWAIVVGAVGLIATLLAIAGTVVTLVVFLNRTPVQTPIYVPAPAGTVLPSTPPGVTPR